MGQLRLEGSLTVGPVTSGDNVFPSSIGSVSLASYPAQKGSSVDSGFSKRNVATLGLYLPLSGLGAADDVTKADTVYFKCTNAMRLRVTYAATPDDIVSELLVLGTVFLEADPATNYIKLLEVKGTGPIEYLVSGQQ